MTATILRDGEIVADEWTVVEDGRTELGAGVGKIIRDAGPVAGGAGGAAFGV